MSSGVGIKGLHCNGSCPLISSHLSLNQIFLDCIKESTILTSQVCHDGHMKQYMFYIV